jgi:hypothetical protein
MSYRAIRTAAVGLVHFARRAGRNATAGEEGPDPSFGVSADSINVSCCQILSVHGVLSQKLMQKPGQPAWPSHATDVRLSMYVKKDLFRSSWMVLWRIPVRALFLGVLAAIAAGLFGAVCGSLLGLATGSLWVCAASWGIRGALAGLAAGAIVGALSGVYHVDEPAQQTVASRPRKLQSATYLMQNASPLVSAPRR